MVTAHGARVEAVAPNCYNVLEQPRCCLVMMYCAPSDSKEWMNGEQQGKGRRSIIGRFWLGCDRKVQHLCMQIPDKQRHERMLRLARATLPPDSICDLLQWDPERTAHSAPRPQCSSLMSTQGMHARPHPHP